MNDEYGDLPNTIGHISTGESVNGVIDFSDDYDLFEINLIAGESYTFTLTSNQIDSFLALGEGPPYILLAEDDDSAGGYNSKITYTATRTGEHYLEASSWGEIGSYVLTATAINSYSATNGNDTLLGSSQADTINALAGNDIITGGAGNDSINGDSGIDTARYSGTIGQYLITINNAARTVMVIDNQAGRNGTDTLTNVEKLEIGNLTYDLFSPALATAPKHAQSRDFLFDSAYYLLSHPELSGSVSLNSAFDHYLTTGAAQGFKPNSWFDPTYYENRWADLKNANLDDATLFLHYNLYGVWEGRSAGPKFDQYDGERYLQNNPDVAAYVDANVGDFLGSRTNGAIAHYIIYGANEGRVAYDLSGNSISSATLIGIAP